MEYTVEHLEKIFKELIEVKNAKELNNIGKDSKVMSRFSEISEKFLLASIDLGVKNAHTDLGVLYNHHFRPSNHEKGFYNYLLSARLGDERAIRLFIRDSNWFNYVKDIDEIYELSVKYSVSSGVREYVEVKDSELSKEEKIKLLDSIKHNDPNVLIDIALIHLKENSDEKTIVDTLLSFGMYWFVDLLENFGYGDLGDNRWFTHYEVNKKLQLDYFYYTILVKLLKRETDKGNYQALLTYIMFNLVGICMDEPNDSEYLVYMHKLKEYAHPLKDIVVRLLERARECKEQQY